MLTELARHNMINSQCRAWGVLNQNILDLIRDTPREFFVPSAFQHLAFTDTTIPIGHQQQMLTPKEEAKIIDALAIKSNERVLEIGTGSGYFTALLAKLAKHVETVDIFEDFIEQASIRLSSLNIHNVEFNTADAAQAYKKNKFFDVIVITGGLPILPNAFLHSLNNGGRLFAYIGQAPLMQATLIRRHTAEKWDNHILFESYVKPLINCLQPDKFIF